MCLITICCLDCYFFLVTFFHWVWMFCHVVSGAANCVLVIVLPPETVLVHAAL